MGTKKRQRYTRYEKARILGARALQISHGAPVLIDSGQSEPILLAAEEFDAGVSPLTVRRNGRDKANKRKRTQTSRTTPEVTAEEIYQSKIGRVNNWVISVNRSDTNREYIKLEFEHDSTTERDAMLWNTDMGPVQLLQALIKEECEIPNTSEFEVTKLSLSSSDEDAYTEGVAEQINDFLRKGSEYQYNIHSFADNIQLVELESDIFNIYWASDPFPELDTDAPFRFRFEFPTGYQDRQILDYVLRLFFPENIQTELDVDSGLINQIKPEVAK
jgi:DNA-directed RNA polymerase subunit K